MIAFSAGHPVSPEEHVQFGIWSVSNKKRKCPCVSKRRSAEQEAQVKGRVPSFIWSVSSSWEGRQVFSFLLAKKRVLRLTFIWTKPLFTP